MLNRDLSMSNSEIYGRVWIYNLLITKANAEFEGYIHNAEVGGSSPPIATKYYSVNVYSITPI